jgi:peptidyl-prolyl cis-trans isomerase C
MPSHWWYGAVAVAILLSVGPVPVQAQPSSDTPPAYQPGQALQEPRDPVVAIVDGRNLHLSDLGDLVQQLPPDQRATPFETLYPTLLDNLIEHSALELKARRLHLDEDPEIIRKMHTAAGRVLEDALLERMQREKVTETAIRAFYGQVYGGKTTVDKVHLRLIFLWSESDAERVLERLQAGEDFATVARDVSRDPSAPLGGDFGLLRREQLRPDVAAVVFSLSPGEIAPRPVSALDGWCIIKVEERASVPPPSFEAAHDELRRLLAQQIVKNEALAARSESAVQRFNMNGTPATDQGARLPPPKRGN